jgi:DNA-binding response OmpR family regulator
VRILLAEDDPLLGEAIAKHLAHGGHAVDLERTVASARTALELNPYHLVVLDLGLPDGDGEALLAALRKRHAIPLIVISARESDGQKIRLLDAGADDYLVKPFALAELEARIRALIRRSNGHDRNVLVHGNLAFDAAARTATIDGQVVDLSSRELAVLELLLLRCGRVIAKEQFVEHLCGWDQDVTENAIEVYVHRLRRKLEPAGVHVQTVRGLGYYLSKA